MYRTTAACLLALSILAPQFLRAADPPKRFVKDESDSDFTRREMPGADKSNHNLESCIFSFANRRGAKYDRTTRWPRGFDPASSGAILTLEEEKRGSDEKPGAEKSAPPKPKPGAPGDTGTPGTPGPSALGTGTAEGDERLFLQRDVTEDGFLSGNEKAGFESLDADRDGIVTKTEFLSGLAALRTPPPAPPAADTPTHDLKSIIDQAWAKVDRRNEADKLFKSLDTNEDLMLSGNEVTPEVRALDADKDGRITGDEFFAEFATPAAPPAPAGDALKAAAVSHAAFADALAAWDTRTLFAMFHPELQRNADPVLVQMFLDIVRSEMGDLKAKSTDDISFTEKGDGGFKYVLVVDDIPCEKGNLKVTAGFAGGAIVDFRLESPRIAPEIIEKKTFDYLTGLGDLSDEFASEFSPQCEAFVRTLFGVGAEAAFALLDPRIQADFKSKGEPGKLAAIAENFGPVGKLELETFRVEGTVEQNRVEEFIIGFSVPRTGKEAAKISFSFAIDGLKAVMVGYSFEEGIGGDSPATPAPVEPGLPAPPLEAPIAPPIAPPSPLPLP